jgi:hypothetical protein
LIGVISAQDASTKSCRANKRRIAEHRVEQQRLVGLGTSRLKLCRT